MIKTLKFFKNILCLMLSLIMLMYCVILIPIKIPFLILEHITFMLSGLTIDKQITSVIKNKTGNEIANIKYEK